MVGLKIIIVHLVFLPAICLGLRVKFYLFTSESLDSPIDVTDIANTEHVVPMGPVKVICHGYRGDGLGPWVKKMARAYVNNGVYNVISVDWSKYSSKVYPSVARKVPKIGERVAEFIKLMSQTFDIALAEFHLIGFSIGAHIVGFAGKHMGDKKVARITALDPAGPWFEGTDSEDRLDVADADFVDAIHTSTFLLGYGKSIGHADFWPNGGDSQPGCAPSVSCSHLRSVDYFTDSIGQTSLLARRCDSWKHFKKGRCDSNEAAIMGDECPTDARGDYYLNLPSKSSG